MSLSCRLCGEPIKFDDKLISHKTGKNIPLDVDTEEPHDYPVWKNGQQHQQQQFQQQGQLQQQYHNKHDIINAVKGAARKSILMLITAKAR